MHNISRQAFWPRRYHGPSHEEFAFSVIQLTVGVRLIRVISVLRQVRWRIPYPGWCGFLREYFRMWKFYQTEIVTTVAFSTGTAGGMVPLIQFLKILGCQVTVLHEGFFALCRLSGKKVTILQVLPSRPTLADFHQEWFSMLRKYLVLIEHIGCRFP